MIYFDNSATTSIHRLALDAYVKTSQTIMGNPSSLHRLGTQANRLLQEARKQIAPGSTRSNAVPISSSAS